MSTSNKRPSRSRQARPRRDGRIIVRGVERDRPDLRKLSRAVIAMAQAEAEREAPNSARTDKRSAHCGGCER